MALRPTIHKASLEISDLDRGYYGSHSLTLARHPSETDERMMVRLLAFAMYATEGLDFGAGLSESDEADLWVKDLTNAITLWIDVGQPDPRTTRKASRRAERTVVLTYGRGITPWWTRTAAELRDLTNLEVWSLTSEESSALAGLARRNMTLLALRQDGTVTFSDDSTSVEVNPVRLVP